MHGMTGARRGVLARMGMMIGAALLAAACRDRAPQAPRQPVQLDSIPRRVDVHLYVARDWAWNEEDTLRVTVVNATERPLAGELNLFVGSPVEVLRDSASAPSKSVPPSRITSSGEGTRVVISLGTIAPGESGEFQQAVRTPPAPRARGASPASDTTSRFLVRAWVTKAGGEELPVSQDTIRIRAGSEVVVGGCGGIKDAAVTRYGVGPLRLDMKAADVRSLCPEARDSTWKGPEGMTERGMAVRLAGNPVLLVLTAQQTVARIQLDSAGIKTGTGVGVGSTLADLRGRYGRTCAGEGEGRIAVWFPAAPGISFGLDSATVVPPGEELDAETLPQTARVDRMWVRQGSDDCPRGEEP
jgi:hypothetical protein